MKLTSSSFVQTCLAEVYDDFNIDLALVFVKGMREVYEKTRFAEFSDVTVEVEEKTFPTHRLVLSIFSGFFRALFNSGMKETEDNLVVLKGITSKTFENILKCLYESQYVLDSENVMDIWKASDMLEILPLKAQCEEFAKANINVINCFQIYHMGQLLGAKHVEQLSFKFILEYFDDIIHSGEKSGFLELDKSLLRSFIESDDLKSNSEDDVVKLVLEWVCFDPLSESDTIENSYNNNHIEQEDKESTKSKEENAYLHKLSEGTENIKDLSLFPRACYLHELLASCRLLLTSNRLLSDMLYNNQLILQVAGIRTLLMKCNLWKLSGNCLHDISSSLNNPRNYDHFENVICLADSHSLSIETEDGNTRSNHFLGKLHKSTILAAAVWNNQVFFVSEELHLCCICLLNTEPIRIIEKDIVKTTNIAITARPHMLYVIGEDMKTVKHDGFNCAYIGSVPIKFISTEELLVSVGNITLANYDSNIVIFGSKPNEENTTVIQCFDLDSNKISRMDDVEGCPSEMVTFKHLDKVFFLFNSGALWKIEYCQETCFPKVVFVEMLWNFDIKLYAAVIIKHTLRVYCKPSDKKCVVPVALDAFKSVKFTEYKDNLGVKKCHAVGLTIPKWFVNEKREIQKAKEKKDES